MAVAHDIFSTLAAPIIPKLFGSASWLSALPRDQYSTLAAYIDGAKVRLYRPLLVAAETRASHGKRHQPRHGYDLGIGAFPSTRPDTKEGITFHFAHSAALKPMEAGFGPGLKRGTRVRTPRASARHAEYIERPEAIAYTPDGRPLVLSNIALSDGADGLAASTRAAKRERREFWLEMEDITRRGGMVQHRLIVELPAPPGDNPSPETVQATILSYPKLLADLAETALVPHGLRYAIAVHHPDPKGDQRNWHAHFAFSNRPADRLPSGAWDFRNRATRRNVPESTRDPNWIRSLREAWAEALNRSMVEQGRKHRYTPKSYAALGVEKKPTEHLFPAAHALERRGVATLSGLQNSANEFEYQEKVSGLANKLATLAVPEGVNPVEWLSAQVGINTDSTDNLKKIWLQTVPADGDLQAIQRMLDTWFLSRPRRRRDWCGEILAGEYGILPTGKTSGRLALEREHEALTSTIARAEEAFAAVGAEHLRRRNKSAKALDALVFPWPPLKTDRASDTIEDQKLAAAAPTPHALERRPIATTSPRVPIPAIPTPHTSPVPLSTLSPMPPATPSSAPATPLPATHRATEQNKNFARAAGVPHVTIRIPDPTHASKSVATASRPAAAPTVDTTRPLSPPVVTMPAAPPVRAAVTTRPVPPAVAPPAALRFSPALIVRAFLDANPTHLAFNPEMVAATVRPARIRSYIPSWQIHAADHESAPDDKLVGIYAMTYMVMQKFRSVVTARTNAGTAKHQPDQDPAVYGDMRLTADDYRKLTKEMAAALPVLAYLFETRRIAIPEPFRPTREHLDALSERMIPPWGTPGQLRTHHAISIDDQRKLDATVGEIQEMNPQADVTLSLGEQKGVMPPTLNADNWSERRREYETMSLPKLVQTLVVVSDFVHRRNITAVSHEKILEQRINVAMLYNILSNLHVHIPQNFYPDEEAIRAYLGMHTANSKNQARTDARRAEERRIAASQAAAARVAVTPMRPAPTAQGQGPDAAQPAVPAPPTPSVAPPSPAPSPVTARIQPELVPDSAKPAEATPAFALASDTDLKRKKAADEFWRTYNRIFNRGPSGGRRM